MRGVIAAAIKRNSGNIVVAAFAAAIPFGLFMALYLERSPAWLWFCAPIVLFLS
jgi:hypothetical protein